LAQLKPEFLVGAMGEKEPSLGYSKREKNTKKKTNKRTPGYLKWGKMREEETAFGRGSSDLVAPKKYQGTIDGEGKKKPRGRSF